VTPLRFWEVQAVPVWRADGTASVGFIGEGPPLTRVWSATWTVRHDSEEEVMSLARQRANEKRRQEAQPKPEEREEIAAYFTERPAPLTEAASRPRRPSNYPPHVLEREEKLRGLNDRSNDDLRRMPKPHRGQSEGVPGTLFT
jgi:hypothetical protein